MIDCYDLEKLTEKLRLEIENIEKQNNELYDELRKSKKDSSKINLWLDYKKVKNACLIKKNHKKR